MFQNLAKPAGGQELCKNESDLFLISISNDINDVNQNPLTNGFDFIHVGRVADL